MSEIDLHQSGHESQRCHISVAFRHIRERIILCLILAYFAFFQRDLIPGQFFIGNMLQKMTGDIEAGPFFVIGVGDEPGAQELSLASNISSRAA